MAKSKNLLSRLRTISSFLSSEERQTELFWNLLKEYFKNTGYSYGTFENEKAIQQEIEISEGSCILFNYYLNRTRFYLRSNFLHYPEPQDASEIFILAQHLNNLIRGEGKIRIDTEEQCCILSFDVDLRPYLFGLSDIDEIIHLHTALVSDARKAYQRLLLEGVEPALIIADLLKRDDDDES
jgi:hypothetical protein